jgi:hypothetical protein
MALSKGIFCFLLVDSPNLDMVLKIGAVFCTLKLERITPWATIIKSINLIYKII